MTFNLDMRYLLSVANYKGTELLFQELEEALKAANNEKENIKSEHEDLLLLLNEQDSQINRLTGDLEKLTTLSQQVGLSITEFDVSIN